MSLFVVFVLGIASLQLAIAENSSFGMQSEEVCPMSHDQHTPADEQAMGNDCCAQSGMPMEDCSNHSCSGNGCVTSFFSAVLFIPTAITVSMPVSIEFSSSFYGSRHISTELRPPIV